MRLYSQISRQRLQPASSGTVTLESAGWEGGRLLPGSGLDKVLYTVADHLGSVRVVKDGSGVIRQRFDYYPYGTVSRMWTASSTTDSSEKRYRFGGKEIAGSSLTDLAGYGTAPGAPYLDFGARLYSPRTATWMSEDPLMEKYYGVSPFVYCLSNPLKYIDLKGDFPVDTIWDLGNVLYDVGAAVVNHIKGDHQTANSHWGDAAIDVSAMLIPYVPAGTSKLVKGGAKGVKVLDNTSDVSKAVRVRENATQGKLFEDKIGKSLGKDKASQITIEVADGTRTKVDFVQMQDGEVKLIEAISSQAAPLTKNQKAAFPQLKTSGGTVKGKKGLEIGIPSGTTISPTEVEIIRPEDMYRNMR